MDADLVRKALETRPHRGAGHLAGRRARPVLDRRLEDHGDGRAARDVLADPETAAVGREVHRRRGPPVAVPAVAYGQQARLARRDAAIASADDCSFTHASLFERW